MEHHFQKQQEIAREKQADAKKKVNLLSLLRLLAFVLTILSGWLGIKHGGFLWPSGTGIAFVSFLILMRLQQSAQRKLRFFRNLERINHDEEKRLVLVFERDDTGDRYQEARHPYSVDLDIFGNHSLFRLIDRTQTAEGNKRLADWLSAPAPLETIIERQKALTDSRSDFEWRQNWQATGMLHKSATQHIGALEEWMTKPLAQDLAKSLKWRNWVIITIAALLGWIFGLIPSWPFWISLVLHVVLLRKYRNYLRNLTEQTLNIGDTLVAYSEILSTAEKASFQGRWWSQQLEPAKEAASALRTLGVWFGRLDFRANIYFSFFIGIPILWDLICLAKLEQWKKKYQSKFPRWIDSLANIEALNSLSGHAFANPDQVLPDIHWGNEMEFSARELGHPLIHKEKRVSNDFSLNGTGQTVLITGSNMSGKSTFLRTVGINLVLAQAGGVVAAKELACTRMQVFTSMRTQDSLEENTSSFYAELKRLKQLIERAEDGQGISVFYLLDEILKGTNSADRHRGAAALIQQLHPLNASGLVSTHDLELGSWGSIQPYVTNLNFRSDLSDGSLVFDYKLNKGVCTSFNASELMRMMGIKIND